MPRRQAPSGASVRISATTYARIVLACEMLKITVSEFIERATLASLQRQEEASRVKAYHLACSAAEAAGRSSPAPEEFGLPRDFGIPVCK